MIRSLIIFASFAVAFFAVTDAVNMFQKQELAIKTPSQVEMQNDLPEPHGDKSRKFTDYQPQQRPQANLFNEKLKKEQNNTLPQFKHKNLKHNNQQNN